MSLPTSYMTGSFTKIPTYFDTMLTAKAPEKFTTKFMSDLGFSSSNDRQFVSVLKTLGFLDDAGIPTQRYYKFLDQSCSKLMVADGIREAYSDLFELNISAQTMQKQDIEGKFRTLTNGTKEKATISYMASTFKNLCDYADWSTLSIKAEIEKPVPVEDYADSKDQETSEAAIPTRTFDLNYDIHIHLPVTRDQAVYDALFASLMKHIPLR